MASGSSIDWAFYNLELKYAYVYELRDKGDYGQNLPPEQIIPSGEETLDSVVTILQETYKLITGTEA